LKLFDQSGSFLLGKVKVLRHRPDMGSWSPVANAAKPHGLAFARDLIVDRGSTSTFARNDTGDRHLRVANLLLKRYGDEADIESALRAEELAEAGDRAGEAIWRWVIDAIGQLENTTPPGTLH